MGFGPVSTEATRFQDATETASIANFEQLGIALHL